MNRNMFQRIQGSLINNANKYRNGVWRSPNRGNRYYKSGCVMAQYMSRSQKFSRLISYHDDSHLAVKTGINAVSSSIDKRPMLLGRDMMLCYNINM